MATHLFHPRRESKETGQQTSLGRFGPQFGRRLPNSLEVSLGLNLNHFVAKPCCAPLTRNEKRFWVDVADLPPEIKAVSPGRSRRAAVLNTESMLGIFGQRAFQQLL